MHVTQGAVHKGCNYFGDILAASVQKGNFSCK